MGRKQAQALLAALISAPLAAQEYDVGLIPPQIIGSPQTMTPLNGGDDSTRVVQFNFPFEYYGQTFTQAWVSSNGFVSFQNVGPLCCDGVPLEQAPRNTIYGYWTDLVSGPNPYYKTTETSVLFGWYGTYEFGTQNQNTFEIGLFSDGKIQFNYGSLFNTWHAVSAGLTGPTSSDNIQVFYGSNVTNLSNQSGVFVPSAPEPVPIPDAINPAPDVTPDPVQEVLQNEPETEQVAVEEAVAEVVTETVEETVSEEVTITEVVDEDQAEDANDEPLSPDQLQALSAIETSEPPTAEEVSQASEAVAEEAQAAEAARIEQSGPDQTTASIETRRDRNVDFFQSEAVAEADLFARETVLQASLQNVAFVAQADAQYTQQYGEQTTTETVAETYAIVPTEGPTFAPVMTTVIGSDLQTPTGQAQQMELLGMQGEMSAGQVIDVGDVNTGDGETMTQLAAVPAGYSAYTQARIPDNPFYQPKDIYKGRRIPDANLALYRMMQGQDQRWNEMVEDQYE
jgi:hypothetical protein